MTTNNLKNPQHRKRGSINIEIIPRSLFKYVQTLTLLSLICISYVNASAILEGQVLDSRRERPLSGVKVCIVDQDRCVTSDTTGNFQLTNIVTGIKSVVARKKGYHTLSTADIHIKSGINERLVLFMDKRQDILELSAITVKSKKSRHKKQGFVGPVHNFNHFSLNNAAGSVNDVNRVVEMLPSVVSGAGGGMDNNLYVRGGHPSENVFVIDGIEVENVSHFGGFDESGGKIGFLNPALVTSLDFFAGAVPVDYPQRLSSVIYMKLREGSRLERKYQLDFNASGISAILEGPLIKDKSSYIANFRFVDLRLLRPFLNNIDGIPVFGDGTMKAVYEPNNNNYFSVTSVFAFNQYDEVQRGYGSMLKWNENLFQYATGAQWKYLSTHYKNKLFLSLNSKKANQSRKLNEIPDTLTHRASIPFNGDSLQVQDIKSWFPDNIIEDGHDQRSFVSVKEQFSLFTREKDALNIGAEYKASTYDIKNQEGQTVEGWYLNLQNDTSTDTVWIDNKPFAVDSVLKSWEGSSYIQYVYYYHWLKMVTGIRGGYYSLFDQIAFSPRFAFEFALPKYGVLSFTAGLFHQVQGRFAEALEGALAPHPGDNSKFDISSMSLQRNWQAVAAWEKSIKDKWFLMVSAYVKYYDREYAMKVPGVFDFKTDTVITNSGNTIKLKQPDGEKVVSGIELMFQKTVHDRFYYSFAYSFFNSLNRYSEPAANERWFNDEFNMRNTFSMLLGSNFNKHHGLSLRMSASEGKPYNKMIIKENEYGIKYTENDKTAGYFTERFDPAFSMHLRYSFRYYMSWGNITGYLEIMNVLNNQQPYGRWFDGKNWVLQRQNGILPVAGVTVDF